MVPRFFIVIVLVAAGLWTLPAEALAGLHERDYQEAWCAREKGEAEYVLPDRTRVDCLTDEYAVEVDFAGKWAEAVGQALFYSKMTARRPGILLILEDDGDARFLERLMRVTGDAGIRVWTIGGPEPEKP